MIQPRLSSDGLELPNGARHSSTVATRKLPPGGDARCRVPPPGRGTCGASIRRLLPTPNGNADRGPIRCASSSGKFFQEDIEPAVASTSSFVGYSHQFNWRAAGPPRPTPATATATNYWEDTNNNARLALRASGGSFRPRSSTSPTSNDFRAEVGGSSYVIAELDGAFTKYWEAGRRGLDWRGQQGLLQGLLRLESLLRQLRPGQHHDRRTMRRHLHRLVLHLGRGRPSAVELPRGQPAGRSPPSAQGIYGFYNLNWNASVGAFADLSSRVSRGRPGTSRSTVI